MNNLPIILTPRLIERLCRMSAAECHLMLNTLCCDEILHVDRPTQLSDIDELDYTAFRMNVMNDSRRYGKLTAS